LVTFRRLKTESAAESVGLLPQARTDEYGLTNKTTVSRAEGTLDEVGIYLGEDGASFLCCQIITVSSKQEPTVIVSNHCRFLVRNGSDR
jgi:hypothetical protein